MDLNRASIIGRLTRDPELRNTTTGKSVATMSVATGRAWKDAAGQLQKQTEFHNVVLWGRLGEVAHQYLRKGRQVYIEGRIQTRDWTGQDGVKHWRTEIIAENMVMLGSSATGAGSNEGGGSTPGYVANNEPTSEVIEEEIKVEDIPF